MILIITLILGILAYYLNKHIRKYFYILLGVSVILSILSIIWYQPTLDKIIVSGYIGIAFYIVVMITGAFKNQSNICKRLKSVRKEYSIIGFILLIPHFYVYLTSYINGSLNWEFYGVVAMLIMIPLFVTSFKTIKRKMKIHTWISLQKFSYLVYLLIFIHVIVSGTGEHTIEYVSIFSFYTLLKINKHFLYNHRNIALASKFVFGIFIIAFTVIWFINSNSVSISDTLNETETSETIVLEDGTYTGTAYGYHDLPIEVQVKYESGMITSIDILKFGATEPERGIDFEAAAVEIVNRIISGQSTNIDTIAGATHTTEGIIEAVIDALN